MVKTMTLTMNGSVQNLATALSDPTVGGAQDKSFRMLLFQPDFANANPIYIGGDDDSVTLSSSSYGFRLEKPTAGTPYIPVALGGFDAGPTKPSNYTVLGTNGEKLHVLGVLY